MTLNGRATLKASELLKCKPLLNYASLEQLSEIFWNDFKWESNDKASELLKCKPLLNYASLEQLSEIFWNVNKWDSNVKSK